MVIEAREAVVRTAQVEIRTLTVTGKQVTLALFRQLPERGWIDDLTGKPTGILWGRVHYQPTKDSSEWQLVWQDGEELCRCDMLTPSYLNDLEGYRKAYWDRRTLLSRMVVSDCWSVWHPEPRFGKLMGFMGSSEETWVDIRLNDLHPNLRGSEKLSGGWLDAAFGKRVIHLSDWLGLFEVPEKETVYAAERRNQNLKKVESFVEKWPSFSTLVDQLYDNYVSSDGIRRSFLSACSQAEEETQLFIAV